jgi:hypothetical protein
MLLNMIVTNIETLSIDLESIAVSSLTLLEILTNPNSSAGKEMFKGDIICILWEKMIVCFGNEILTRCPDRCKSKSKFYCQEY